MKPSREASFIRSHFLQLLAYILLIPIFIFIIGIFNDCGRAQTTVLEGNSGGDTLDIALLYVPGSFYSYEDSVTGINHQIALQFSEETSTPIKLWPLTDAAKALSKVKEGSFDILASLPLDNTLKKNFTVSESIFLDRLVLVQMTDSLSGNKIVNSSLDLNGKTVYVATGSSASTRMRNLANEIGGDISIEEVPDLSDELICLKVVNGSFPLAVVNEKTARKISELYPLLNYDSSVSFTQFQVWVFSPTDSIVAQKFNTWFDTFRETDTYRSIINNF